MNGIYRISSEDFKKAPIGVKAAYVAMVICAVTGLVLIMVDIFAVGHESLTAALAFIVASQIINLFGPCRYARKINLDADRDDTNRTV